MKSFSALSISPALTAVRACSTVASYVVCALSMFVDAARSREKVISIEVLVFMCGVSISLSVFFFIFVFEH